MLGRGHEDILQYGVAHVPAGRGVDASLMFGDYFFLRALNAYTDPLPPT